MDRIPYICPENPDLAPWNIDEDIFAISDNFGILQLRETSLAPISIRLSGILSQTSQTRLRPGFSARRRARCHAPVTKARHQAPIPEPLAVHPQFSLATAGGTSTGARPCLLRNWQGASNRREEHE
jgi:hypothetical protein